MSSHSLEEQPLEELYNFLKISDSIATAGQPTATQFAAVKNAGYEVVINLALPTSTNAIANEQEIVESLEMRYVHIPVLWENPTLEDFNQFFQTLHENTEQKVLIHCAMNMRVSVFVYLYRQIHDHLTENEARQDLQKIWTPNETWQAFIEEVMQQCLSTNKGSHAPLPDEKN